MLGIVVAAVALKVEIVAPAATVTVVWTVNNGLLLDSEIATPPAGADVVNVAVQVEIWPPFMLPEVHVIEETAGTAIIPPVAVNESSPEPVAATPTGFDMLTGVVVALTARVS